MDARCLLLFVLLSACRSSRVGPADRGSHFLGSSAQEGGIETRAERFFDWSEPAYSAAACARRRVRIAELLRTGGGGVLLVPSAPGRSGGGTFRQTDDFHYFTGLEVPDAVLAIDADRGESTLFLPARDARFESESRPNDFPGRPLGDDPELRARSGLADLRRVEELTEALHGWQAQERVLWVDVRDVESAARTAFVRAWSAPESLLLHLREVVPDARIESAHAAVARLRMVKSPDEVALLRRACAITCAAIVHAAGELRAGIDERTLAAEFEAETRRRGAQRLAFDSIVKSGPNALWPWRILAAHYDRRNRVMHDGELVIFDVGCELDHYASDVGRTFPVSGRFDDEQRRLLEQSTRASDAVLAAIRPGITFAELRELALAEIAPEERRFMQTGSFFGHHVGLAVGDPSLDELPLAPGMTFTVEPWYYDHERSLAVFLEDVVVVTETGCDVLTRDLPRAPRALEALVGARRGARGAGR